MLSKEIPQLDRKEKWEVESQQKYRALKSGYNIKRKGLRMVMEELKQYSVGKKAKKKW